MNYFMLGTPKIDLNSSHNLQKILFVEDMDLDMDQPIRNDYFLWPRNVLFLQLC